MRIKNVNISAKRVTLTLPEIGLIAMTRGAPSLNIIVVPDSGTGELTGLSGKMSITIAPGGAHSYAFEYTLPE